MLRLAIPTLASTAIFLLASPVHAQIPGADAAAATTAATTAAPAAAGAAAAGGNIWSKICMTPAQKQACKDKLCAIPLVPMLGSMLSPMRAMSGGLIPSFCPGPNDANPADLAKPADSAEGAAARIKQQEAQAKARRAAVRYLGTVDCRRYPEAEAALIASLLTDENECVRYEAALAFANGCCCTKKVLEALTQVVSCRGGKHPPESSPRVRWVAGLALERCVCRFSEVKEAAPLEKPVGAPTSAPGGEKKEEKKAAENRIAPDPLLEDARRVLVWHKQQFARLTNPPAPAQQPNLGQRPVAALQTREPVAVPVFRGEPVGLQRTMAHAAATTPAVVAETKQPTPGVLPPTGQRDLFSLFRWAERR